MGGADWCRLYTLNRITEFWTKPLLIFEFLDFFIFQILYEEERSEEKQRCHWHYSVLNVTDQGVISRVICKGQNRFFVVIWKVVKHLNESLWVSYWGLLMTLWWMVKSKAHILCSDHRAVLLLRNASNDVYIYENM